MGRSWQVAVVRWFAFAKIFRDFDLLLLGSPLLCKKLKVIHWPFCFTESRGALSDLIGRDWGFLQCRIFGSWRLLSPAALDLDAPSISAVTFSHWEEWRPWVSISLPLLLPWPCKRPEPTKIYSDISEKPVISCVKSTSRSEAGRSRNHTT